MQDGEEIDLGRRKLRFLLTPMVHWPETLLRSLSGKRLTNRVVGIFGSYGWGGGAVKGLRDFVEQNKLELVEPVVEAKFTATPEHLEQCHNLGRAMAERIRRENP